MKLDIPINYAGYGLPEFDDLKIALFMDECPKNPREGNTFGTLCGFRNGAHCHSDAKAVKRFPTPELLYDHIKNNDSIYLPVYVCSQSGETLSVTPFDDPWDSAQLGVIFVEKEKVLQEFGDLSKDSIEKAKLRMKSEVETLDAFLCGETYGYAIQNEGMAVHDEIEAWGFYSEAECLDAALKEYAAYLDNFNSERKAAAWIAENPERYFDIPAKWRTEELHRIYERCNCHTETPCMSPA